MFDVVVELRCVSVLRFALPGDLVDGSSERHARSAPCLWLAANFSAKVYLFGDPLVMAKFALSPYSDVQRFLSVFDAEPKP